MDKTIFHRKVETMKKTMFILALVSLAILVGCKKKEEPAMPKAMDMSNMTKDATAQAEKTAADAQKTAETAVAAVTEQTTCPVMEGNPIDKNVFVEYKGKKVYFCCDDCKAVFEKDPEKYISKLPQFKQ